MTTQSELEAFLLADVVTALGSTWKAYVGNEERINPNTRDVQIHHERREPVRRDGRWLRHHMTLYLRVTGWDDGAEETLSSIATDAADALVDRYDGQLAVFATGIPLRTIVRVRATRLESVDTKARKWREARVRLQVDEMAGGA
jgi:hypothetical protein